MSDRMTQTVSAVLILIGVLPEFFILPDWIASKSFGLACLLHGAAAACLIAGLILFDRAIAKKKKRKNPVVLFAAILVIFFPIWGIPGAFFLYALMGLGWGEKFQRGVYDDYEKYILERTDDVYENYFRRDSMRKFREELSFKPFIDIMAGQEVQVKIRVIEKLSKSPDHENVMLLKAATRDPSPEIRLYAASALLKIEAEITERIQHVLNLQGHGTAKVFADLGDLYRIYAQSGLLEQTLAQHYLRLSCEAYRKSLDMDTNQPGVIGHYCRCLIHLKDYPPAKDLLDRVVKLWPQDVGLNFLRNEVYFELRSMDVIGESFSQIQNAELDEVKREVVKFWTNAT